MSNKNSLTQLLSKHRLDKYKNALLSLAEPSFLLRYDTFGELKIPNFGSKLSGQPDLPKGTTWPKGKDFFGESKHLDFLGQVNLAELPENRSSFLPNTGLLSFFVAGQDIGHDSRGREMWKVFYFEENDKETKRRNHPGTSTMEQICPCKLEFDPVWALPKTALKEFESFSETDRENYEELLKDLRNGNDLFATLHRIGGHPDELNPVDAEIVRKEAEEIGNIRADDWILLAQFSHDDEVFIYTPGNGRFLFWIPKQDLVRKRFDRTWLYIDQT